MATVVGRSATAPAPATPKPATGLTGRARAERRLGLLLTMPSVVLMALVAGFPILYSVWLSLHRSDLRFPALDKFIGLRQLHLRC